jgi:hypothetical protein
MQDAEFVRAVAGLRDRQGCAPTTGDVAAALGLSRQHAWRRLRVIPQLLQVPGNPAPTWEVREALSGPSATIHAMVVELGELARGMTPEQAAEARAAFLAALDVAGGAA